jgi:hypothetical protein
VGEPGRVETHVLVIVFFFSIQLSVSVCVCGFFIHLSFKWNNKIANDSNSTK